MKKLIILLFIAGVICVLTGAPGCKKDKVNNTINGVTPGKVDARDSVTGTYSGIEITFNGDVEPFYDTVPVVLKIKKGNADSLVCLNYNEDNCDFSFIYRNYAFKSTYLLHPPTLRYLHDSIFFFYQPSLAPRYNDDRCKRVLK